jgi:hypothetical protein
MKTIAKAMVTRVAASANAFLGMCRAAVGRRSIMLHTFQGISACEASFPYYQASEGEIQY